MIELTPDKIPLVIGVSGHRNLHPDELILLKQKIVDLFQFFQEHYPHTPLLLLSPLAEGADRLVAEVAIANKIPFIAPFPLPEAEYRRDFKTPECIHHFDSLLQQALHHFELPVLGEGIEEKGSTARRLQYALVGAYVARHSHILIALWDGQPREDIGGTYQIMQYRLKGDMLALPETYKPSSNPLDFIDTGKVCHIKVSRAPSERHPATKPFLDAGEYYILSPEEPNNPVKDLKLLLSPEFTQIDQFNRDVDEYTAKHGAITYNPIIKKEILDRLSKPFHAVKRLYEVASVLSIENHKPTDTAILAIFLLGIFMVAAIEFYAHPFWLSVSVSGHPNWLLGLYLVLFAAGYGIYRFISKQQKHVKYLHYRALAEALRIQMFWLLGGLNTQSIADFYSRKHYQELGWVRSSIRALTLQNWVNEQESREEVREKWVRGQLRYFCKNLEKNHRLLHRLNKAAKVLFLSGFLVAIGLFFAGLFAADWLHHHHSVQNILIVLMVLLPATGAALDGYGEKVGLENDVKRYRHMIGLFDRAEQQLQNGLSDAQYQALLQELGQAALEENSEWVLFHRDHPVDVPKG